MLVYTSRNRFCTLQSQDINEDTMYVFGEDNFEIIFEHNKQRLSILMLKYLPCSFLLTQVQSSPSPVIISTLTVIFPLKTTSRLSVRLSLIADNGGLGRGAVGRCRQIRI